MEQRASRSGTRSRGARAKLGVVDYSLAKRALLHGYHGGLFTRFDLCDAHPELLRAARYVGEPAKRPCPVCKNEDLKLLAYVYADGLKTNNGRVWALDKGLAMTVQNKGACCYVVEVCTYCSWNHLSEAFTARSAG